VVRGTQDGSPVSFETFCCKVLAGIDVGSLPDTIRDRAIVITLERRKRSEPVERFRVRDIADQLDTLRSRLEDWAAAESEPLGSYRCQSFPTISERLEAWEPLLGVAELAGGPWPKRARDAVLALASGAEAAGEDHGQLLLEALQQIFDGREVLFTKDICSKLNEDDELPFGAYRKGDGIDGRAFARKLKPYEIRPETIEYGGENAKGYRREWFLEPWARYVRAEDPADDASGASARQVVSENGATEPEADLTDDLFLSVRDPSGHEPAFQSHNGGDPDGLTDVTDEVGAAAGGCSSHPDKPRAGCRYCVLATSP